MEKVASKENKQLQKQWSIFSHQDKAKEVVSHEKNLKVVPLDWK